MAFKIFDQEPSWLDNDGDLDLYSQEMLSGTEFIEYTFKMTSKNKPDDFLECGGMTLISDKILNVINKYKDIKAIFHPVTMLWNGVKYYDSSFYFLEVVEELKCVNYKESRYKFFPFTNRIMSLYKLVTYPIDTEKHKLFIIEDTCFLCIDDHIGDELIYQGCTGFNLIETSEAVI